MCLQYVEYGEYTCTYADRKNNKNSKRKRNFGRKLWGILVAIIQESQILIDEGSDIAASAEEALRKALGALPEDLDIKIEIK